MAPATPSSAEVSRLPAGDASAVGGPAAAIVRPVARLRGTIRLPGDKSISHRALLLALLAAGESRITGAGDGRDVRATAALAVALGATVERTGGDARAVDYRVVSPGAGSLTEPAGPVDCMNSGTTLRLGAGVIAGQPLFAVLDGDGSLRQRPMGRVVEPLVAMGAAVAGRARGTLPPLAITGQRPMRPIDHTTPVPSAQVKSAVLLAGLAAEGTTTVREQVLTRDHTERMLRARGLPVRTAILEDSSAVHAIDGPATPRAIDQAVPGDLSGAAFWLVAAAIHPDAELRIAFAGTNPTRRAIIDLLRRMGAEIEELPVGDQPDGAIGEPVADLLVRSSALRGTDIGPAEVAAAIDEIPVLCLAAAVASGRTVIRGVDELRHKESDRVAGIADGLIAMGARVAVDGDRIEIEGGRALRGAPVDSHDDHRLAMTFAVAGLIGRGETTVAGSAAADVSYPGFFAELERVSA